MVETFKVIIAGGRDFDDYIKLKKSCDRLLANKDNIDHVDPVNHVYCLFQIALLKTCCLVHLQL